ncbi:MAG TPA: YceD family protein [Acidimicrobiales bacterium]|nr:YceD family protein [Acidimicrobiales bacterium]
MSRDRQLRIGVTDLLHRPGTRREVRRSVRVGGLEVSSAAVPDDAEIDIDLVVESTADPGTLTITGHLRVPWVGQCRRCLGAIEGDLDVEVLEVAARHPDDEDIWALQGDELDLSEMVREAALLALPIAPLCDESCRGPVPDEFPARPAGEAADDAGPADGGRRDERWAALDDLRFDA